MERFRRGIFMLLKEGQELSGGEKMLVNQIINDFSQNYKEKTGEEPRPLFGIVYLIAPLLEAFGFNLPRVERWGKEDVAAINQYLSQKK